MIVDYCNASNDKINILLLVKNKNKRNSNKKHNITVPFPAPDFMYLHTIGAWQFCDILKTITLLNLYSVFAKRQLCTVFTVCYCFCLG